MRHRLTGIVTLLAFALTISSAGSAGRPVEGRSAEEKTAFWSARLPASGRPSAPGNHVPGPGAYGIGFGTWMHVWADVKDGHVLIGRRHQVLWRSSKSYPITSAAKGVTAVLVGAPGVAFRTEGRDALYVAAGRGRERPVARGEWPEAWTPSGNLITIREGTEHGHDWAIVLRRADGSLVRTLADRLSDAELSGRLTEADGWFWFWTAQGGLVRTNGERVIKVSNHRALEFRQPPYITALAADLILLYSDDWRVVVLRRNGAFFARASAPTDGSVAGFGDSFLASPGGRVVVYALTKVTPPRTTTIFTLHEGDTSGTPIFRTRGADWGCAPPPVTWVDDRRLLFRYSSGHAVAIDTSGRRPSVAVDDWTARRAFDANPLASGSQSRSW